MIEPRIVHRGVTRCVGQTLSMSILQNRTAELWRQFSPKVHHISNRINADRISLQVYPTSYFNVFDPHQIFEKWALVEVSNELDIPSGMQSFVIEEGLYAVFDYKGPSNDPSIFQHIYSRWIPNSIYRLDDRPHFEVLGAAYKNNDPSSEEEIWIPIMQK